MPLEGKWYSTDILQCHSCMLYSVGSLSHSYIHSLCALNLQPIKHSPLKTGGLPLFQAPVQSAFLLILKLCYTVNLFQSWNLIKWICIENIIQARPLFFHCIYLKGKVFVFSRNKGVLFSQEREILFSVSREIQCQMRMSNEKWMKRAWPRRNTSSVRGAGWHISQWELTLSHG